MMTVPTEAGGGRLLELVDRRIRTADADADHAVGRNADAFGGAHGAEHGFVVEAEGDPLLDVGMLVEHDGRGVERGFRVGLGLRRIKDVLGREAVRLQHRDGAFDTVDGGRQLVVGNADRADFVMSSSRAS